MNARVYLAVHRESGTCYVGHTIQTFAARKRQHLYHARKECSYHFHRALRLYGEAAFDWLVCNEFETAEESKTYERLLISCHKASDLPLYNITRGGDSGRAGLKYTEEQKMRMSIARRGIGNPMYGKTFAHTEASKEKMRGRKVTEETRACMRIAQSKQLELLRSLSVGENNPMYGRKHSEETKAKMRAAKQRRREQ